MCSQCSDWLWVVTVKKTSNSYDLTFVYFRKILTSTLVEQIRELVYGYCPLWPLKRFVQRARIATRAITKTLPDMMHLLLIFILFIYLFIFAIVENPFSVEYGDIRKDQCATCNQTCAVWQTNDKRLLYIIFLVRCLNQPRQKLAFRIHVYTFLSKHTSEIDIRM